MNAVKPSVVHRTAALVLLAAGLGLVWVAAVRPVLQHVAALKDDIRNERQVAGALAAAADPDGRVREAALKRAAASRGKSFVSGGSEAIESANLQALVSETATGLGLRFASVRTLPLLERDGLTMIGVRAELAAPLDEVQTLLHRLESIEPLLIIEAADLIAASLAGSNSAQPPVEVTLSVYGAVLRDKRKGGAP